MKCKGLGLSLGLVAALCSVPITGMAQSASPAAAIATATATSAVPRLVSYSGVLKDAAGTTITGITGVTFLLYKDQQGGAPVWLETQSVTPDRMGHYTVQLGAARASGLPAEVFTSGEGRWLAVQVANEAEQARVLLVAVPYAMKAADAETIGGLPPSAFVLAAPPAVGGAAAGSAPENAAVSSSSVPPPASTVTTTTGGAVGKYAMFTSATNVENAHISESGSAINARANFTLPAVGTATSTSAKSSYPVDFISSVFNSTTSTAVNQHFRWIATTINNNTSSAAGSMRLQYGQGTSTPTDILKISKAGVITFAPGQTFPIIAGGVTNTMLQHSSITVNAGTDLTGGGAVPLGGSVTLNVDPSKISVIYYASIPSGTDVPLVSGQQIVASTNVIGTSGTYFISASALPWVAAGDGSVFCYDALASTGGTAIHYGGSFQSNNYAQASVTDVVFVAAGDAVELGCETSGNNGSFVHNAELTATLINTAIAPKARATRLPRLQSDPSRVPHK